MNKQLIIYLLSGVASCLAGRAESLTLAERVRQADVIAFASVQHVGTAACHAFSV